MCVFDKVKFKVKILDLFYISNIFFFLFKYLVFDKFYIKFIKIIKYFEFFEREGCIGNSFECIS